MTTLEMNTAATASWAVLVPTGFTSVPVIHHISGGSVDGNSAFADGGADNDNIDFGSLQNQATIIGGTGGDYIAQTSFNNQRNYAKKSRSCDQIGGETINDGNDNIDVNQDK